jgi:hypothetical protein
VGCDPGEHLGVDVGPQQFDHIIGQRIPARGIGVEETAERVEAVCGERAGELRRDDRIGVVEDGVYWMCRITRSAGDGADAIGELRPLRWPVAFLVAEREALAIPIFKSGLRFNCQQFCQRAGRFDPLRGGRLRCR